MNRVDRKKLKDCIEEIDTQGGIIEEITEDIQDRIMNLEENFPNSNKLEIMEDEITILEDITQNIQEAFDNLSDLLEG